MDEGHPGVCQSLDPNIVPYECEGALVCCTVSTLTTVTFKDKEHWGECAMIEEADSGNQRGRDDEEEVEEDDECSEYSLKVCCDGVCTEEPTEFKTSAQVRAAKVCSSLCLKKGGRKCNWRWHARGCPGRKKKGNSISCIEPLQYKVRRDGHEAVCSRLGAKNVRYVCDGESKPKLCCSDSGITSVTFKNKPSWGECTKMGEE